MNETIYLTFKTEKSISETLKIIAKSLNMTQPELINNICKDFIEMLEETARKEIEKEK